MTVTKPVVNGSSGTWGTILNQALDDLDSRTTTAQSTADTANTTANTNTGNITTLAGRVTTAETNITALQTGGGSGGTAPVLLSTVTTKGDLIAGTGAGTVTRAPVGTSGRLLVADPTTTSGLNWTQPGGSATGTSGSRPTAVAGLHVYETDTNRIVQAVNIGGTPTYTPLPGSIVLKARQTVAQTFTTGSQALFTFDTEDYDRLAGYTTTSNTFTPGLAGWYQFDATIGFVTNTTGTRTAYWYVNGAITNGGGTTTPANTGGNTILKLRTLEILCTATTSVQIQAVHNAGVNLDTASATGWAQASLTAKYLGNA